ncbi:NUDIX hydrolase [Candidatus Microgenomates bacterium]|nr:NUDIX hydrolase [Candidatus Microgenomates bacterium]
MAEEKIVVNAGAMIFQENKVLLVLQAEGFNKGKWNFPLGGMEPGEKLDQTAIREAKEETGLDIQLTHFVGLYQQHPSQRICVLIAGFRGVPLTSEIKLNPEEILEAKWFTLNEVKALPQDQLADPEMVNAIQKAIKNPVPLNTFIKF